MTNAEKEKIMVAHRDYLLRLAQLKGVRLEEDREDIVQTTMLVALRLWDESKGTAFRTYLIDCLKWEVHDFKRKRISLAKGGRCRAITTIGFADMPRELGDKGQMAQEIEQACYEGEIPRMVEKLKVALTPRQFEVVNLKIQGLRNVDIAKELGMSESNVGLKLRMIQEKMRHYRLY